MIQQQQPTPQGQQTIQYVGGLYEHISTVGQGITHRHHISVAGNAIAVVETQGSAATSQVVTKESYLHKNHQGSVLAISDDAGQVLERRYYDAFGDIKSQIGQAANTQYAHGLSIGSVTAMAFTGHRSLIAAGVIHMGGRVYDATIGRFLSADPHIQSPLNSQSLNRYSYTLNNPLSWTDPSGYFFDSIFKALKSLFKMIGKIIKAVLKVVKKVVKVIAKVIKKIGQFVKKYWRVIVAVVVAVAIVYFTAGAGAASGLIMTGSLKGALEGAFFGAVTAGFAHGIGSSAASQVENLGTGVLKTSVKQAAIKSIEYTAKVKLVIGHAIIGGIRSLHNGGKFLTGALTAGLGKLTTFGTNLLAGDNFSDKLVQGLAVATAGGILAELAGGSFELGFLTAGLAFAVNEMLSSNPRVRARQSSKRVRTEVSKSGNQHSYKYSGTVCHESQSGCDAGLRQDVFDFVNDNDVPLNPFSDDSPGGHTLFGFNPIRHEEYSGQFRTENHTLDGHMFHDGSVTHRVFFDDAGFLIYSVTGAGVNDGLIFNTPGFNNFIGEELFRPSVNAVVNRFGI